MRVTMTYLERLTHEVDSLRWFECWLTEGKEVRHDYNACVRVNGVSEHVKKNHAVAILLILRREETSDLDLLCSRRDTLQLNGQTASLSCRIDDMRVLHINDEVCQRHVN